MIYIDLDIVKSPERLPSLRHGTVVQLSGSGFSGGQQVGGLGYD